MGVGSRFDMCRINKDFTRIDQVCFIALLEDVAENLFKKVCIFESASIVLPKRREVRYGIKHIKSQEPFIGDVDLDFLDCLPHAFDSVEILDKRNFDQHDRIHTGPTVVSTVLILNKIIDK